VCRVGSYWLDGLLDPQFIESHQSISLMRVAPENLLCGSVRSLNGNSGIWEYCFAATRRSLSRIDDTPRSQGHWSHN
jgi:hypothetical protein